MSNKKNYEEVFSQIELDLLTQMHSDIKYIKQEIIAIKTKTESHNRWINVGTGVLLALTTLFGWGFIVL